MATTYLTCSTQQLLETIAVLAANVTIPLRNGALTGLFNNSANYWQFPDNPANQKLASGLYIDCNNTVPGSIVVSGGVSGLPSGTIPTPIGNAPVPADGPFGSGISVATTFQLLECIIVLQRELTRPYPWSNQTGLFLNGANQLQFPDNAANQLLGSSINVYGDGVWLYIQQTAIGQPATGA